MCGQRCSFIRELPAGRAELQRREGSDCAVGGPSTSTRSFSFAIDSRSVHARPSPALHQKQRDHPGRNHHRWPCYTYDDAAQWEPHPACTGPRSLFCTRAPAVCSHPGGRHNEWSQTKPIGERGFTAAICSPAHQISRPPSAWIYAQFSRALKMTPRTNPASPTKKGLVSSRRRGQVKSPCCGQRSPGGDRIALELRCTPRVSESVLARRASADDHGTIHPPGPVYLAVQSLSPQGVQRIAGPPASPTALPGPLVRAISRCGIVAEPLNHSDRTNL